MLKRIFAALCMVALLWICVSFAATSVTDTATVSVDMGGQPSIKPTSKTPGNNLLSDNDESDRSGNQQKAEQGTAAVTIASDAAVTSESYTSDHVDENALHITGNITVLMSNVSVVKIGGTTSADNSIDYGQNAGLLATDGASATIAGAQISTDGYGANGVFSYGIGTHINISDSTITTVQDHAGGILVTGGGMLSANHLSVQTQGNASAAIRSGQCGGAITVDGGTYTSTGAGSPAIYSNATITVSNATLAAIQSEAIVVEGRNSVTLINTNVSGNMQGTHGKDSGENIHNVMLCQSNGSSADVGGSKLSIAGGSLTALAGDMFYVTNTDCDITLTDVALSPTTQNLLTVAGNDASQGWGVQGGNGGNCHFTANGQTMGGTIFVDAISSLALSLENGTSFTGTLNPDGQAGVVNVTMDDTCPWTLTADAYVTSFIGKIDRVITNSFTLHVAQ